MDCGESRDSSAETGVVLNNTIRLRSALLLGVLGLVTVIKLETGGWFLLIPGIILYPAVIGLHFVTHGLTLYRPELFLAGLKVIVISHFLLLIGFLLQYDVGDGAGWIAIAQLFDWKWGISIRESQWWTKEPLLINSLAFIPVAISWAYMIKVTGRPNILKQGLES